MNEPDSVSVPAKLDSLARDLGADGVNAIVESYLSTVDGRHDQLRAAAESANTAEVSRLAHAYKSSAAALGATRLARTMHEVEKSGQLDPEALSLAELARRAMLAWQRSAASAV